MKDNELIVCRDVSLGYEGKSVLTDLDLTIAKGDYLCVVGDNGSGKSTLMRGLLGLIQPQSGTIEHAPALKHGAIGYLPQQQGYHSDLSIYEELLAVKKDVINLDRQIRQLEEKMSSLSGPELEQTLNQYHRLQTTFENGDGYTYKSKVLGVINGLGFGGEAMHQCINHLSGGQKTRVALGKLLLTEPDLLILDEPTNHLDMESIQWLETYLINYKGSVLVVSHDRYFLDRIAQKIVELDHGKVTSFKGNYSDYSVKKAALRETLIHQYYNQQQQIRHQEQVITKLRQFNREKSIKRAESREKMLNKMDRLEKPVEYEKNMSFSLEPSCLSGKDDGTSFKISC